MTKFIVILSFHVLEIIIFCHTRIKSANRAPLLTGEEQPCLRREPKTTDAVRGQFYPVEKSKKFQSFRGFLLKDVKENKIPDEINNINIILVRREYDKYPGYCN